MEHKKSLKLEAFDFLEVSSELHNVLVYRCLCLYEIERNKMATKKVKMVKMHSTSFHKNNFDKPIKDVEAQTTPTSPQSLKSNSQFSRSIGQG